MIGTVRAVGMICNTQLPSLHGATREMCGICISLARDSGVCSFFVHLWRDMMFPQAINCVF